MDHVSNLTLAPEDVLTELTSEDFLVEFSAEVGVELSDLSARIAGDQSLASMKWSFPTAVAGVPELARQFLPSHVNLTWDQVWGPLYDDDTASGQLIVRLTRRPAATATGACSLEPNGGGTLLRTRTRTQAELPFPIAGRIESLIDRDLIGWILEVQVRVLERRAAR